MGSLPENLSFAPGLDIQEVQMQGVTKYRVHDPRRGWTLVLGARELATARIFDGRRSLSEVQEEIRSRYGVVPRQDRLEQFASRMVSEGLLRDPNGRQPERDPLTGLISRWLHVFVRTVARYDPNDRLDQMIAVAPWIATREMLVLALSVSVWACVVLVRDFDVFIHDLLVAASPWSLVVLVVVLGVQSVFHEGAHALACKAYGVGVREVGFCFYFLVPVGWTRPDQTQWSSLTKSKKIVTAVVGPLGSVAFGALGVAIWQLAGDSEVTRMVGVVTAFSTIGTITTLIPTFGGDAYLVLTELLDRPGYRQCAFNQTAGLLRGQRDAWSRPVLLRLGDALFVVTSCLMWVAMSLVASFVVYMALSSGGPAR